jgi:homoserine dehydrogenase
MSFAEENISLESIMQRHFDARPIGGADPSAARPVPVILITYATTEDAVRRALAQVEAERVIEGKPQLIRIEKT